MDDGGFDRDSDYSTFEDGPGPGHGLGGMMRGGMGGPPFRGRGGPPWRGMRGGPPRGLFDNGFGRPMGPPRFRGGGRGFLPPGGPGGPMMRGGGMPRGGFPNRGGPGPHMRMFRPGPGGPFDGPRHGNFGGGPPRHMQHGGGSPGGGGMMHKDGPPQTQGPGGEQVWAETPAGEGKSYYYHTLTRETTWDKPEGPGVKIIPHSDWVAGQSGDEAIGGGPSQDPSDQIPPTDMGGPPLMGRRGSSGVSPPGTSLGGPGPDKPMEGPVWDPSFSQGQGGEGRGLPSLLDMRKIAAPGGRGRPPFSQRADGPPFGSGRPQGPPRMGHPEGQMMGPGPELVFRNPAPTNDAHTPMLAPLHNLRQAAAAANGQSGPRPTGRPVSAPEAMGPGPMAPQDTQVKRSSTGSMVDVPQQLADHGPGPGNFGPHPGPGGPYGSGQPGQFGPMNGQGMKPSDNPYAQPGFQPQSVPRPQGPMGGLPPGHPFPGPGGQIPNQPVPAPAQGYPPFMGAGTGQPGPYATQFGQQGSFPGSYQMYPNWGASPSGVPPPLFQLPVDPIVAQLDPKVVAAAQEWSEHLSPEGKSYFYNNKTQTSIWEKPKALVDFESAKFAAQQRITLQAQQVAATATAAAAASANAQAQLIPTGLGGMSKVIDAAAAKKAQKATDSKKGGGEKCRPISSTPVPGTPWCVVWTGDRRVFFYNPSNKQSVWERPTELIGRMDVEEWTRNCPDGKGGSKVKRAEATSTTSPPRTEEEKAAAAAEVVKVNPSGCEGPGVPGIDPQETDELPEKEPPKKKQRRSVETETKGPGNEPSVVTIDDDSSDEKEVITLDDKDSLKTVDAVEAETKAAKERAVIPLEDRLKQFKEMLVEKEVSAFSTWEKELHKIVFDSRYLLLNSKERKLAFEGYVKDRAEEERKEKKLRIKQHRDQFLKFLKECHVTSKMTYNEFSSRHGREEKFKLIEKPRDREFAFSEYIAELKKREKEERAIKKENDREEFLDLLREKVTDYHIKWSDVKKKLESDDRYKAVDAQDREDIFYMFQRKLKHELRAVEKQKKKEKKERDREKEEKEKAKLSPSKKEGNAVVGDEALSQSAKKDDAEGTSAKANDSSVKADEISEEEEGCITDDSDDEAQAEREKKERMELSMRERERQVQRSLAGHLRDRDKEREYHRHGEASQEFQALLSDLVRNVEISWKDARKAMKKDKRWKGVSILTRDEMEDIYIQHCDTITKKKKLRFQELLAEAHVKLTSTWHDVRKKIRDDPRFEKFSTSDRKCEREFEMYLKELSSSYKNEYRELLKETKMINYKSKSQYQENPSVLKDIESLLANDKRFLQMESMAEERKHLLLDYLDDMQRKGPPPPPTASEPARRAKL